MQHVSIVPIDSIIVPSNRVRRQFDEAKLKELSKSIESKGLLQAPVVREDGITLLAGERRLRAIKLLYSHGGVLRYNGFPLSNGFIPVVSTSDLDTYLLREAELEENTIRDDLTWQEKAAAISELYSMRSQQREANGGEYTVSEMVEELVSYPAAVTNSLRLAKGLSDPEIANAPTEKDALKILQKKVETAHRAKLAERFDLSSTPHQVVCLPFQKILPSLTDNSVDILLTDPPYGIDAQDFGSMADARHEYEDSIEKALDNISNMLLLTNRICKPESFAFIFCDIEWFPAIRELLSEFNWTPFRTPLIWNKSIGMLPWPDYGPRRTYEAIVYAHRGTRKWNVIAPPDIIAIPGLTRPTFGAEKPRELYSHLLKLCSVPGDVVLDPFAGTGPVLPAATDNRCRAIAIDSDREKYEFMLHRLEQRT